MQGALEFHGAVTVSQQPELKVSPSGTKYVPLQVEFVERVNDHETRTNRYSITFFMGKNDLGPASNIMKYVKPGMVLYVSGRLTSQENNGKFFTNMLGNTFKILAAGQQRPQYQQPQQQSPQYQQQAPQNQQYQQPQQQQVPQNQQYQQPQQQPFNFEDVPF